MRITKWLGSCILLALLSRGASAQETFHSGFWKLFEDLGLDLKVFTDSNGDSSPGVSYVIDRKILTGDFDLAFKALGNVAFKKAFNTQDFLETSLVGTFDRGWNLSEPSKTGDASDLENSEVALGDRLKVALDFRLALEANQDFTQKQYAYGAALDVWAKIDEKKTVWWNLFDYPAAALRALSGYEDEDWQPQAGFYPKASYALPTLSLGIDQVNVDENDPRAAAGDTSDFARFRLEASMRSPVAVLGGQEIFLLADYRLFRELGASDKIKAADLDSFDFATLAVADARGFFLRYTTGMLPFDVEDSQAYEIGWSFNSDRFLGNK